ncbi:NAD(P)-dependent alcohol dehydrogenase [Nocardioides sp. MJB4]|uniref:NAD(P)-dependent alcohol dehydrogenase n=2 Tax=Nocardioides donggukensis TaxID=2774019 RepID=A0A927Q1W7_9ACTN|nr:NAD(P)-dependent alcohol dehydrogenase [Nocardioides donggukensis]
MRAVVHDRYGTSKVLRTARIVRPSPGDHEVLVEVHAAGLDRGTEHLLTGKPYAMRLAMGLTRPKNPVPGRDVAGIVVEAGAGVTRFAVGDEVYGVAPGSFADYAVAHETRLAHKPTNLTFLEAAVVPVSAGTALRALVDVGGVQPGQNVLVVGASGGVGSYAVQLAKAFGAEVTGVCSAAKADLVTSLGAANVLDYDREDFANGTHRYDLVLDIAGNSSLRRLRRALRPRGTVVFVGGEDAGALLGMGRQVRGLMLSRLVRQRLALLVAKERGSDYNRLAGLIEEGRIVPALDRSYPLEDTPLAVHQLETGRVRGKVAISVRK